MRWEDLTPKQRDALIRALKLMLGMFKDWYRTGLMQKINAGSLNAAVGLFSDILLDPAPTVPPPLLRPHRPLSRLLPHRNHRLRQHLSRNRLLLPLRLQRSTTCPSRMSRTGPSTRTGIRCSPTNSRACTGSFMRAGARFSPRPFAPSWGLCRVAGSC